MRADLGAAVDKIAAFLEVQLAPEERAAVVERSSFAYMRRIELITRDQQRRIDDYWRAELERIGCDFPYDAAFNARRPGRASRRR